MSTAKQMSITEAEVTRLQRELYGADSTFGFSRSGLGGLGTLMTPKGVQRSKLDIEADRIEERRMRQRGKASSKKLDPYAPYLSVSTTTTTGKARGRSMHRGKGAEKSISRRPPPASKGGLRKSRRSVATTTDQHRAEISGYLALQQQFDAKPPQISQQPHPPPSRPPGQAGGRPSIASASSLLGESNATIDASYVSSTNRFYNRKKRYISSAPRDYTAAGDPSDAALFDSSNPLVGTMHPPQQAAAYASGDSVGQSALSGGNGCDSRPATAHRATPPAVPPVPSHAAPPRSADVSLSAGNDITGVSGMMLLSGQANQRQRRRGLLHSGHGRGDTLLRWCAMAGVELAPKMRSLQTCLKYSQHPERGVGTWQRWCRANARKLEVAYNPNVPAPARKKHRIGGSGASGRTGRSGPAASGASASLRDFRALQIQKRKYALRIVDYLSSGPSYISGLWRQHLFSSSDMDFLFSGRYVIPTKDSIETRLHDIAVNRRKQRFFRQIMYNEFGIPFSHNPDDADEDSNTANSESGCGDEGDGNSDGEGGYAPGAGMEEDDNDDGAGGSGQGETQPFLQVGFDRKNNVLQLSCYVGADTTGEDAIFVGKATAACIDNCRWYITRGMWRGKTVFFQPLINKSEWKALRDINNYVRAVYPDGTQTPFQSEIVGGGSLSTSSPSQPISAVNDRPLMSQPATGVASLIVHDICFEKVLTDHQASTASDPFICTRCGNTRTHNAVYISKRTGALCRGSYYCGICHAKTPHAKCPPGFLERIAELEEIANRQLLREASSAAADTALDYSAMMQRRQELLQDLLRGEKMIPGIGEPTRRPAWSDNTKMD